MKVTNMDKGRAVTDKPKSKVQFVILLFAAIAVVNFGPRSWNDFGWRVGTLTVMAWVFHYALCYVFRAMPTHSHQDMAHQDMASGASKLPISSVQVVYSILLYLAIWIGVFYLVFSLSVFIIHWFYYALFQVEHVRSGVTESWNPPELAVIIFIVIFKGLYVIRYVSGLVWLLVVKTFLTRVEVLECMNALEQYRQLRLYPQKMHPVLSPENKVFNLFFDQKQNGQE